ncbi:MAG: hypothetical protein GY820_35545, partial [Gammaproteobacteria bacterium]|nr:hypothetical protein [Gammaproteobacteria bacterium]
MTETWLNDTIPDSLLLYDTAFCVARCDRVEQRGGGVALFYKKSFKVAPVFIDSCFSSVEVVAVDVISSSLCTIRIICAYCPPDCDPINVSLLIECITSLCLDRVVCLVGDFNMPGIDWGTLRFPNTARYESFMFDMVFHNGLTQYIRHPTRGNSILDLLFSNDPTVLCSFVVTLPFADSCDHSSIEFDINFDVEAVEHDATYRNFRKTDWVGARAFLDSVNWVACFVNCVTIDDYWSSFYAILSAVISQFVPLVRPKRVFRYPAFIRRLLLRKRRANVPSVCANPSSLARYLALSVRCSRTIKRFEIWRERKLLETGHLRAIYSFVKKKRGLGRSYIAPLKRFDGSLAVADVDKAYILNNYFSSVFTIDNGAAPMFNSRCDSHLASVEFPPSVVYDKLCRLKPSLSCGPDGIPKLFLKRFAFHFCLPLSKIFEFSFSHAVLPSMWRCADILPLFKKGSTSDVNNYRPVSLTCTCCRVMETIVKDRVSTFLAEFQLLSSHQHGFRAARSTCSQLLECLDDWTKSVRDNIGIHAIYVDFAKAFDTV